MKKLILFFTSMVITMTMMSTNNLTGPTGDNDCTYCCPKCKQCNTKEAECAKDKCAMVKSGTYCCSKDMTTSETAAKCPKCNKNMKKVECQKKAS